jgi:hypothetical protein
MGGAMDSKNYMIGGVEYVQYPIVLAQLRALLPLIQEINFSDDMSPLDIVNALGDKLSKALAIVLIEKDSNVKEALGAMASRSSKIECAISLEQTLEVIEDFFACNRVSSLVERLGSMMRKLGSQIGEETSKKSSGDSPGETSPKGRKSSGA